MADNWTVRIDEEEKEKLNELIQKSGFETNKDFFMNLVSMYELSKAKDNNPLLAQDIEELQKITNRINGIYLNIGERIDTLLNDTKEEYIKQLAEKQVENDELREKKNSLQLKIEEIQEIMGKLKTDNQDLEQQLNSET